MDRTRRFLARLIATLALSYIAGCHADEGYATWHPWQLDSVLVVWALEAYLGHPIPVESVPRGTVISGEIAIDTPDAAFRRTGQRTAFEEAVRQLEISHPCVPRLREAVRVVEFAGWRRPEYPAVEVLESRVIAVLPTQAGKGGLEPALAVINGYCQEEK